MSVAEAPSQPKRMTAEEFYALPDDGVERELIDGVVRIRGEGVTWRNHRHSKVESRIAQILRNWLDNQPLPKGTIASGEAGFRIKRDPDSIVRVDVAYASAETVAGTDPAAAAFEGAPVLAVEILSPSDKHEDVVEKVRKYLEVGTVVWIVDPDFETVRVHRVGQEAETFNKRHELVGDPDLPGFRVRVADLFS